jgi:hypothetical protein
LSLLLLGAAGAAPAGAASSIEGVWSFNGGQIGVQRLSNGTYNGIVVSETKFAECPHPVGQEIWTGITQQSDGSFWGLHRWYSGAPPACQENPVGGPTAWRVLEEPGGAHYLRVCFSHPGTSQPSIAASGAPREPSEYSAYHVTYGCFKSDLIAPLPVAPGTSSGAAGPKEVIKLKLPSAKGCVSTRLFKIHLQEPKYDPFKSVTVTLKGHRVHTSRQGDYVVATINLRGFKKGTFTITIRATTVLGHRLSSKRTFHTCGAGTKTGTKQQKKKAGRKG